MPSCIMEPGYQGGGFQIRSISDCLGSMSKVYGVFSNKDLLSISVRQPSAMVVTYNVLRVSWTTLATLAASHYRCWKIFVCLFVFVRWLLRELLGHKRNFHFIYIHIH